MRVQQITILIKEVKTKAIALPKLSSFPMSHTHICGISLLLHMTTILNIAIELVLLLGVHGLVGKILQFLAQALGKLKLALYIDISPIKRSCI